MRETLFNCRQCRRFLTDFSNLIFIDTFSWNKFVFDRYRVIYTDFSLKPINSKKSSFYRTFDFLHMRLIFYTQYQMYMFDVWYIYKFNETCDTLIDPHSCCITSRPALLSRTDDLLHSMSWIIYFIYFAENYLFQRRIWLFYLNIYFPFICSLLTAIYLRRLSYTIEKYGFNKNETFGFIYFSFSNWSRIHSTSFINLFIS